LINPRARPCDEQVIRSARSAADCTAQEQRWVLVATILASVIAYIDESVVNVALPVISKDLATSVAERLSAWFPISRGLIARQ